MSTFLLSYFPTFSTVIYLDSHFYFVSLRCLLCEQNDSWYRPLITVNYATTKEYRQEVSEHAR